jgi:hypothetical protein
MYHMENTTPHPTASLTSVFGKDNHFITLLQSTVFCVFINIVRVNNENYTPFSFFIKERVIRQCHVNFASAYDYNND